MTAFSRQPRHTPTGGQFASRRRSEPPVNLLGRSDEELASNPSTDQTVLTSLSYSKSEDVRRAIAGNPSAPPEVLGRMLHRGFMTRQLVLQNPGLPDEIALAVAGTPKSGDLFHLALNTDVSDEVIAFCAQGTIVDRTRVAMRLNCPANILEELAGSDIRQVLDAVAMNPGAPAATRRRAAKRSEQLREHFAASTAGMERSEA